VGSFRQGTDGRTAWSQDPVFGLRELEGAELEESLINAAWNAEPDLASLYVKVTSVPPPKDAEAKLECVELHTKGKAKPTVLCFDAQTPPSRPADRRAKHSRRRDPLSGGVQRLADRQRHQRPWFEEKMTAGPSTVEAHTTSLVFDEKIPASKFNMPKP